jgi:hypothetical protein
MPPTDNAEKLLALVTGPHPAATLTGDSADDTLAISAGTGQKLSLTAMGGTINGGTP